MDIRRGNQRHHIMTSWALRKAQRFQNLGLLLLLDSIKRSLGVVLRVVLIILCVIEISLVFLALSFQFVVHPLVRGLQGLV